MYNSYYGYGDISPIFTILLLLFVFGISACVSLYFAFKLYSIAKAEGRNDAFLAFIPIGNVYLLFDLAGGNKFLAFAVLLGCIPFIGSFLLIAWDVYFIIQYIKLCNKYGISTGIAIVSIFFTPLMFYTYHVMSKNAKSGIGTGYSQDNYDYYNQNQYQQNNYGEYNQYQ